MQTFGIWIVPSMPPGSPQGFNTWGTSHPSSLALTMKKHHLSEERARSGTQAKGWDHSKDEGQSAEKNHEAEVGARASLPSGTAPEYGPPKQGGSSSCHS